LSFSIPRSSRRPYATERAAPKPRGRPAGSVNAKKTTAEKTTSGETSPKKKKKKRKRTTGKTKKKAAPKRKKKVLTAEEKAKVRATKKARLEREEIKTAKAANLKPPKALPFSAFTVLNTEMCQSARGLRSVEAAARLKNLSSSELEVRQPLCA
jgi:hypothetical protein